MKKKMVMSNQKNSNSFREILKINTPTKSATKPNGNKNTTTANTHGERCGQGRTKDGHTR